MACLVVLTALFVARHDPERIAGRATGGAPDAAGGPASADPHPLRQVAEVARKDDTLSRPDEQAMELRDGVVYVGDHTETFLRVSAVGVDGALRWERSVDMTVKISGVSLVALPDALFVDVRFSQYADVMFGIDPTTGEVRWDATGNVADVVANRVITFRESDFTDNAYDLTTLAKQWSVPDEGGLSSHYPQHTWESLRMPRDDGDEAQLTFHVGPNEDPDQYLVNVVKSTGALAVLDLGTGTVRAQGNVGEKVTDVVVVDDTVFVYRQTPRTLAAYTADMKPVWRVDTPTSADGALIDLCGRTTLCLKQVTPHGTPVHGVDTKTGAVRWTTLDYAVTAAPRVTGELAVVSHKGGTAVLNPLTGNETHAFAGGYHASVGDGAIVGFDGPEMTLLSAQEGPVSLGDAPSDALAAGRCEWSRELVLCAEKDVYRIYRYRG